MTRGWRKLRNEELHDLYYLYSHLPHVTTFIKLTEMMA
jgi:hypothetical protein